MNDRNIQKFGKFAKILSIQYGYGCTCLGYFLGLSPSVIDTRVPWVCHQQSSSGYKCGSQKSLQLDGERVDIQRLKQTTKNTNTISKTL